MTQAATDPGPWQGAARPEPFRSPPMTGIEVGFVGRRSALFWLALKTGFMTILTLGFYRFWMKTRLRRWYWSAIRPGGHPMEYVGDPWEKLLGFFIAVVILTFYIGIVNLLLMFISFSIFNSSWIGYLTSFAGIIPLWFYARYRARRYVLARTRWRGVRFGLEKGAWGYAGRALVHWTVTILSLGVLWPRMTFSLEKYRTDRTVFGSARLHQGGRWQMLYRAAVPIALALLASAGVAMWLLWLAPVFVGGADMASILRNLDDLVEGGAAIIDWHNPQRLWLVPLCISGLIYGAVHYRWVSKRIMANHKTADGIAIASRLSGPRVMFIYALGNFIAYLALVLGVGIMIIAGAAMFGYGMFLDPQMAGQTALGGLPRWVALVLLGIMYLSVFLMWGVLHNTFVTFPLMRHLARTTTLPDAQGLGSISQRDRDAFAEAEGFAEALDLGAAI